MVRVLHISDTHFLRSYEGRGGADAANASAYDRMLCAMGDITGALSEALSRGCAGGVDLIVLTGDLTDDGDEGDYRALRRSFDAALADAGAVGTPVLVTPGNHDHVAALRAGWYGQVVPASELPFAPQVEVVGGVAFVTFDSARFGYADGFVDDGRVEALDGVLSKLPKGTPIVLATHHHLDPGQFATPAVDAPDALWDCLAAHGVRTILTGHTHHQARGFVHGIPYYTADGLSFQGDNLYGRSGVGFTRAWGFNRYEVAADGRVSHVETHTFSDGSSIGEVIFSR
ncbi:MAG: metallophosphoesterase [Coriobacteriia bacterium]|nr:metallophosphoesterase [Coriobacteriia bacterium]